MIQYYHSHIQLPFILWEGQEKFLNAELMIGAGGLGCPCLI
jgi:hypothetical protein